MTTKSSCFFPRGVPWLTIRLILNTLSDLRQVPDTQEVFLSPEDDTSIILEILEVVTEGRAGGDLWEAIKSVVHFESGCSDRFCHQPEVIGEQSD